MFILLKTQPKFNFLLEPSKLSLIKLFCLQSKHIKKKKKGKNVEIKGNFPNSRLFMENPPVTLYLMMKD